MNSQSGLDCAYMQPTARVTKRYAPLSCAMRWTCTQQRHARTESCMSSCFVFEQTETISQLKENLISAQAQLHTALVAAKVGRPCSLATPLNTCSKV